MMFHRINVTRTSELFEQSWSFTYMDGCLILDSYIKSARATRRHKFVPTEYYERLGGTRYGQGKALSEADAPLPDDVVEEAGATFLRKITDNLRVIKWSERRDV